MSQSDPKAQSQEQSQLDLHDRSTPSEKPTWETPKMEDVSEQVMAQPYIRFT